MNKVTVIKDKGFNTFSELTDIFNVGISLNDGLYLFDEDNEGYAAVSIDKGTMMVEEFSSRLEALLWLLDYKLWKTICNEYMEDNDEE